MIGNRLWLKAHALRATQTPMERIEVEEQAQAWIKDSFSDPEGKRYWQNRFSAENMETAYCAGFTAGLEYALVAVPVLPVEITDVMVEAAQDAWIKTRLKSAGNHKAAMRAALTAAFASPPKPTDQPETTT